MHIRGARDAAELGIETVYQDLALADNLDIVQNMFLGRERLRRQLLDEDSMERAAADTLSSLRVTTVRSIRQPVASLSGGQRQSVAVAKAVMWNSKVVLLDEPTAALGVVQTRMVLDLVRRLRDRGLAVMVISHNLNDVFEVADRLAVLHLGRMVAEAGVQLRPAEHGGVHDHRGAGRPEVRRCRRLGGRAEPWRPSRTSLRTGRGGRPHRRRRRPSEVPPEIAGPEPGRVPARLVGPAAQRRQRGAPGRRRLVVVAAIFEVTTPEHAFLSPGNLVYIFQESTVYMVLAMAEIFVLLLGEIDLSIGYVALFGGVVTWRLVQTPSPAWPWWAAPSPPPCSSAPLSAPSRARWWPG